jgi:argininosuccinate lyase
MKLWGGRFARKRRDQLFEKFSESFSVDRRLVLYDLRVNLAYVRELGRVRVLSAAEGRKLARGLEKIRRVAERNTGWSRGETAEDIHTWVEARLEREVGAVARKLRTGRSRNDLVATDTRLYVKDAVRAIERALLRLQAALVTQARAGGKTVLPGYTHLQPAQPILFAHYLLAYFEMLARDLERLEAARGRSDELPMGAGALAGAAFPVNRERLARALGFERVSTNSLDSTSDRDFVCETLFACALAMVHLSRLAEDLILYSSPSFGFVEFADAYATGSSLMPQKKNPDALELIRGKSARVLGRLTASLALVKGLPLAYNRDLQEDKPALFDGLEATRESLEIAARVVATLRIRPERMRQATAVGFLTATDLADELVRRGVPFADAHEQVGRLVRYAEEKRKTFGEISREEARRFLPGWDARLESIARSPESSVARRRVFGGTAPAEVARQLRAAGRRIAVWERIVLRD